MANPRKTVEELKRTGTWRTMTKAEQAERISAETVSYAFGTPERPANLSPREKRLWDYYTGALLEKRLLAQTDGPMVMDIVHAKLLGDDAQMGELVAALEAREPFPETEPESEKETPTTVQERASPNAEAVARAYALDVTSGAIVACKFVKLACKRFLSDLGRKDISFDPQGAQHVVNYITQLGLVLLPWQVFILSNLFGWKLPSGLRRFRYAFVLVAKKNGKTALSAALALYMADPLGDGEPYSNCYVAATTKAQSQSLCFKAAVQLRENNPHIAGATRLWKSKASITWPNSVFEPLAANSEKLNGMNIHFGCLDELGDHPNSALHNVFTSSTTGRKQPLIVSITTAGENREQIAYEQRARAAQVLEGALPGDSFFAYVAELDEGDSPEDEKVWIKANPSLGVLVPVENIRDLAQQAAAIPSTKHSFLRYSFNIWSSSSITSWINYADLEAKGCAYLNDADKVLTPGKRMAAAEERLAVKALDPQKDSLAQVLANRRCFAGLDLALVNDLSALCLLFPPVKPDGVYECLFRFWCPEENITQRTRDQRVPYQVWKDSGYVIATPGQVTDFSFIKGEILALRKKFRIMELGFDRALAEDLCKSLEIAGMKVTQVSQGFGLSPALLRTERLIVEHKFCTFGHPIANWNFSNVSLAHGYKGDVRVEKMKSREKIDGAVAAAIAMFVTLMQPVQDDNPDRFKMRFI